MMQRLLRWWLRPSVAIAWISTLCLLSYEIWFRHFRPEYLFSSNQIKTVPYLFQNYASDDLLQTVKIGDLVSFGPAGLWYFHVQPPIHELMIYFLALPETLTGSAITSEIVDLRIYVVYAVIYGLLNALLFVWLRDLTKSFSISLGVTILWAIYPGNIATATLLDGTYLSTFLIALMLYLMYRFLKTREPKYVTLWLVALAVTSYTRSVFQIHFMVLLLAAVVSFWWMEKDRRRLGRMAFDFFLVLVIVALPIKNYVMWGSFSTTSFGGFHRTGMLYYDPLPADYEAIVLPESIQQNAQVFVSDNNNPVLVKDNYAREQLANRWIAEHSPLELAAVLGKSLNTNFQQGMAPTSMYSKNEFSHGLPWRAPMDALFSGYAYVLLSIISVIGILVLRGWRGTGRIFKRYGWLFTFYLLIAGTILLQNRNEWSEAHRLKFLVEIPVWLAATFFVQLLIRRFRRASKTVSSESDE